MFIDICNTDAEATWAEAYHTARAHKNIKRIPVSDGDAAVSSVEPDPATQFKLVGKYFEMGVKWVVTAEP